MSISTRFFFSEKHFLLRLNFLNIILEIRLIFSEHFFLTFTTLFSLIAYLFSLGLILTEDGSTIKNKDKRILH